MTVQRIVVETPPIELQAEVQHTHGENESAKLQDLGRVTKKELKLIQCRISKEKNLDGLDLELQFILKTTILSLSCSYPFDQPELVSLNSIVSFQVIWRIQ